MNHSKRKTVLALLPGLAATVVVVFLLSTLGARAATLAVNSCADGGPGTIRGYQSLSSVSSTIAIDSAQAGSVPCLDSSGALEELVDCILDYMPHRYSVDGRDGFDVPTITETAQWRDVVRQMMEGECDTIDLGGYGWGNDFAVTVFTDTQDSNTYCVFAETKYEVYTTTKIITRVTHGWGTFIYDPAYLRELNISAPHAKYETETATEAIGIFENTRSRTFLMTGAHRHASDVDSSCQSAYERSDAAHNTDHMFHATVEELVEYYDSHDPEFYHLQFHGMSSCCSACDVHLSHGSSQPSVPGDKISELRDNLSAYHTGWSICVPGGPCGLNGTENVQGRLLNGVPGDQVCDTPATDYSGYFIHIEQCADYRESDDWFLAINDTWAPHLTVTKRADPDPVLAGAQLTYTLRVTNTGDTHLHTIITDTLPPHVTPTGVLTWTPTITTPGGVWIQTVIVTIEAGYVGTLTNVVQVTTTEGATGVYTETSEAQVTPMLEVTKQADPDPVQAGEQLTYTIHVTNTGNVTLHATVTDTLPAHVTPSGTLTWMSTITSPGGVWMETVVITVTESYSGTLTNVAQVTTIEGATGSYTETSEVQFYEYPVYLPLVLKNR